MRHIFLALLISALVYHDCGSGSHAASVPLQRVVRSRSSVQMKDQVAHTGMPVDELSVNNGHVATRTSVLLNGVKNNIGVATKHIVGKALSFISGSPESRSLKEGGKPVVKRRRPRKLARVGQRQRQVNLRLKKGARKGGARRARLMKGKRQARDSGAGGHDQHHHHDHGHGHDSANHQSGAGASAGASHQPATVVQQQSQALSTAARQPIRNNVASSNGLIGTMTNSLSGLAQRTFSFFDGMFGFGSAQTGAPVNAQAAASSSSIRIKKDTRPDVASSVRDSGSAAHKEHVNHPHTQASDLSSLASKMFETGIQTVDNMIASAMNFWTDQIHSDASPRIIDVQRRRQQQQPQKQLQQQTRTQKVENSVELDTFGFPKVNIDDIILTNDANLEAEAKTKAKSLEMTNADQRQVPAKQELQPVGMLRHLLHQMMDVPKHLVRMLGLVSSQQPHLRQVGRTPSQSVTNGDGAGVVHPRGKRQPLPNEMVHVQSSHPLIKFDDEQDGSTIKKHPALDNSIDRI